MKSSIEILNSITEINNLMESEEKAFNSTEGDVQAAHRDSINSLKGKRDALNEMLADVLAEEEKMRAAGGVPLVAKAPEKESPVDFIGEFLGSRDDFKKAGGLYGRLGEKMKFAHDKADPTYKLPTPKKTDYSLPGNIIDMPMGVIDVISKGTTDSNMEYMIPGKFTNNAAEWTPGTVKAESDESWGKDEATMFWLAHSMPVSRDTLSNYGQLQAILSNDLMTGLRLKEAAALLNLDSSDTKKGILKKTGIQKYAAKQGDTLYDSVRRMKTMSWMETGIFPNYVAMHPLVTEHLDLMKDKNERYMMLTINGRMWGVPIVEDVNLVSGEEGSQKYGVLLFNSNSATWYTAESDALQIGLVNDQFVRNEFTLLAEGKHLITVQRPKSFVYMEDALAAPAAAAAKARK